MSSLAVGNAVKYSRFSLTADPPLNRIESPGFRRISAGASTDMYHYYPNPAVYSFKGRHVMQAATKAEESQGAHNQSRDGGELQGCGPRRTADPVRLVLWICFKVAVMCNKDAGEMAWSLGPRQSTDGGNASKCKGASGRKAITEKER